MRMHARCARTWVDACARKQSCALVEQDSWLMVTSVVGLRSTNPSKPYPAVAITQEFLAGEPAAPTHTSMVWRAAAQVHLRSTALHSLTHSFSAAPTNSPTPAPTTPAPESPTGTPTSYPTRAPTSTPTLSPTFSPTYFYDLEASVAALGPYVAKKLPHTKS